MFSLKVTVTVVLTATNWAESEGVVVVTVGAGSVLNSRVKSVPRGFPV